MLPIIPKISKLSSKSISDFSGIDTRLGAKENSFFALKNVDVEDGYSLTGNGNFLYADPGFPIDSNYVIAVTNKDGESDIYSLGEGGFYKNGEFLPFKISHQKFDITWIEEYVKNFTVNEDSSCNWTGDYSSTKLIRHDNYVFAIPQMLATDGINTFFWDCLACGQLNNSYFDIREGLLTISSGANYWKNVFSSYYPGDEVELFINSKKCTGTFTVVSNISGSIVIKCIRSDGTNHLKSSLGITSMTTQDMAIRHKGIPQFADVLIAYNRIWGVAGNRVHASKLANPFTFNAGSGTESDAWWADTDDSSDFTAIASLNGRIVGFKKTSTYEVYGTVNPYTIKDVSRSLGCIDKNSVCEVNGVLFLLTTEGMCVYGGGKFVNINEKININETEVTGVGIGSKFYCLKNDGIFKYDYYTDIWTNLCDISSRNIFVLFGELFALTHEGGFLQLTGIKKDLFDYPHVISRHWVIESGVIGGKDFYAEGINKMELRFESSADSEISVEVARDNHEFEECGKVNCRDGWQIFTLPITFKPCSSFKYRISGTGKTTLRVVKYSYRKGGMGGKYE